MAVNDVSETIISGTAGGDSIINIGLDVTITGGAGDDTIVNQSKVVSVYDEVGSYDTINYADNAIIDGGTGADLISNNATNVSINGGAGADTIENFISAESINGNEYNFSPNYTTIEGGAGNDSIKNSAGDVTIAGGAGSDTIINSGENVLFNYTAGDGNDIIQGFNESSTLNISGTIDKAVSDGTDIFLAVGENTISLKDTSALNLNELNIIDTNGTEFSFEIIGTEENDTLNNILDNVTLSGLSGNDVIANEGIYVAINGGAGNDTITNSGNDSTIDAGTGNDIISNEGASVEIKGGAGNDSIVSENTYATIAGGGGSDTIINSGENFLFQYTSGDGNDLITGFNANSTLQLLSGSIDSATSDGTDIFLTVGDGTLSLKSTFSLGSDSFNIIDQDSKKITLKGMVINIMATGKTYENYFDNTPINGSDNDDTINNYGASAIINGGKGADSITNANDNVTINGGAGNDTVVNTGANVLFQYSSGDGNDLIQGFNDSSSLQILSGTIGNITSDGTDYFLAVGNGTITLENTFAITPLNISDTSDSDLDFNYTGTKNADSVDNYFDNVSVKGNAGNDIINNYGLSATLSGDAGADKINNFSDNAIIDGGAGNDSITNAEQTSNVEINGGADNDSIINDGSTATINGGAGNDVINNSSRDVTISGGEGTDTIINGGTSVLFQYTSGDGNDLIQGFDATSTLQISDGSIASVVSNGTDIFLAVGKSTISLTSTFDIGPDSLNIVDESNNNILPDGIKINGTTNADSIDNYFNYATISANNGNDTINNYGANVIVNGEAGADNIYNNINGTTSTLSGGAGNDIIDNYGANVSISGGDGNDSISNGEDNVTINGGAGTDTIINSGLSVLFQYAGGNDSIQGFDATSTLKISSGTVGNVTSDESDIFIAVGSNTITIGSAFSLDSINVVDKNGDAVKFNFTGTGNAEEISNYFDNVTVGGGGGNDTMENRGDSVTIDGGEGVDEISNNGVSVSITGGAGNDSISNSGNSATIWGGAGNDEIDSTGENVTFQYSVGNDTISGFKENSTLQILSGSITSAVISESDLLLTVGKNTVTMSDVADLTQMNVIDSVGNKLGLEISFDETIDNHLEGVTVNGGTSSDTISNDGENVVVRGNAGDDVITNNGNSSTINGGDGDDDITNSSDNVSVSGYTGSDSITNYGINTTILGGAGDDYISNGGESVTIDGGGGKDYIENTGENVTFRYSSGGGNDTISGFKEDSVLQILSSDTLSGVSSDGTNIFLSVGQNTITLEDAFNITQLNIKDSSGNKIDFELTGTEGDDSLDNYLDNTTLNGLGGNDILTNYGVQVSIAGGAGDDDITNSGNSATISGDAGNDSITNSGEDVLFQYASGGGSDLISGFTETSTLQILSDNVGNITSDGISIFVTLGEDAVTLENAFALDTINIIDKNGDALSFNFTGTDADDSVDNYFEYVTVNGLGGNDTLSNFALSATIDGGAGGDSIANEGSYAVINGGASSDFIFNTGDYSTLNGGDGGDEITNEIANVVINGDADADTITNDGQETEINGGDGDDSITSTGNDSTINGNAGDDFIDNDGSYVTVNGGAGKDTIVNDGQDVEINGDAGNDSIANSSSNVSISGGAGSDKINNSGSNVTIEAGAGNDRVSLSSDGMGGNTFLFSSTAGKDMIYALSSNDTIKITDDSQVQASVKGNDVVFTVGRGSITAKDAAKVASNDTNLTITLVNKNDEIISEDTYTTAGIISDGKIDLVANLKKQYAQADDVSVVNGAAVKSGVSLVGGTLAGSTLIGGKGNDTLISNENTFELTGGAGNDIFVFGGGDDTITDYSDKGTLGSDKISIASISGLSYAAYELDEDNVILNYANGSKLTIQDGKGKKITFTGNKSSIFGGEGLSDKKYKGITLAADVSDSFDATISKDYSKLVTIDGSATDAVEIIGNKKANYIKAGNNGSTTLNGGKGNDTLVGGDGADTFVFESNSGNKVIDNYGETDIISLGSDAAISQFTTKSDNVVLKVGSNKITVVGTAESSFRITENGVTKTYTNEMLVNGDAVTLASSFKGEFDLANYSYKNVSAELGNGAVTMQGNAEANYLSGGKGKDVLNGGAGADTLWGGKGNDTLIGGAGSDTFIYQAGTGNDVISGYANGELLQILDKNGNEGGTFKTSLFDGTDLTLKIKGGGKVTFTGVSNSTSFNINGETYRISGSTLTK